MTSQRQVWAYRRTSTDDKGQVPDRQDGPIAAWCQNEGFVAVGKSTDEGKSGFKTSPFERKGFLEAIDEARDKGCEGIIVETGDRFTRKGTRHFFVYAYQLQEQYNLKLYVADEPLAQQQSGLGEVIASIKAMAANEWIINHSKKVKSGMQRKRCKLPEGHVRGVDCNGTHFGHPTKTFTAAEANRVWEARQGLKKVGWKTLALEINTNRGAFKIATDSARKALSVTSTTVRRLYANLEAAKSAGLAATLEDPKEVSA